jgi:hypothetical protein
MDQHRGQEHHRRVEVEHCSHQCDECERDDEQASRWERRTSNALAERFEQPVVVRRMADEQQSDHEHERRPRLAEGVG